MASKGRKVGNDRIILEGRGRLRVEGRGGRSGCGGRVGGRFVEDDVRRVVFVDSPFFHKSGRTGRRVNSTASTGEAEKPAEGEQSMTEVCDVLWGEGFVAKRGARRGARGSRRHGAKQ